MKIVIEGADGTGKTTLAEFISNKFNAKIIHSTSTTKNDFKYHMELLQDNNDVVFDRFHLGEFIYSDIFNRKCKMTPEELFQIQEYLKENDIDLIILVADDFNFLLNRLNIRGEEEEIKNRINRINDSYYQYGSMLEYYDNVHFLNVNYCNPIEYVDALLSRKEDRNVKTK